MTSGYWKRLGVYRTLPLFFVCGAAIEWFMINVRIGKETFCECDILLLAGACSVLLPWYPHQTLSIIITINIVRSYRLINITIISLLILHWFAASLLLDETLVRLESERRLEDKKLAEAYLKNKNDN